MPAPADFLGVADKTSYKNTFFGFSFEFSNDWYRLNDAEIQASKDGGTELLKTENKRVNKAFEAAVKEEVAIFAIAQNFENDLGANLIVGVLKQPNSKVSAETIAIASQKFFLTNSKITLLSNTRNVQINKVPFSTFTVQTNIDGNVLNQKIYATMRKGYSISFVLTYRNPDSLKAIEKIMQTLKFDAK